MEMTQEWVEQFIKKCADFLGKDYDTEIYSVCTNHLYDCGYRNPEYIENPINWDCYHSDWNWIMEVVERIENTKTTDLSNAEPFVTIRLVGCDIKFYNKERLPILTNAKTKKQAVIQAIDQFIDWYNKQKES